MVDLTCSGGISAKYVKHRDVVENWGVFLSTLRREHGNGIRLKV
jgi:hypothetical protein